MVSFLKLKLNGNYLIIYFQLKYLFIFNKSFYYSFLVLISINSIFYFFFDLSLFSVFIHSTVVALILSLSLSDPGIVPSNLASQGEVTPDDLTCIINGGEVLRRKYCVTCKVYRPPRGKHCGLCNSCIDRFDHHCMLLSVCIGSRNYRRYVLLLLASGAYSVYGLACGIKGKSAWLIGTSSIATVVIGNLFIYHARLIFKGQTTYEQMNGECLGDTGVLSYWSNLKSFFFTTVPDSMLNDIDNNRSSTVGSVELGRQQYSSGDDDESTNAILQSNSD